MATAKKTWITILIAAFIRGADDNPTFRKLPVAARAEHAELRMLHVRLYDPDDGKIVRVEIPFWLIRFGMSVSLVRGMESVSL